MKHQRITLSFFPKFEDNLEQGLSKFVTSRGSTIRITDKIYMEMM